MTRTSRISLTAAWLRLQIALRAASPVALLGLLLCAAAAAALAWVIPARALVEEGRDVARRVAAQPAPAAALAPPAGDDERLRLFYDTLGARRQTERQLEILFAQADKAGLVLRQGEYKAAYDRNARLHTYQVTLPVKGSYGAIWQFALGALGALPFAALDELSFKREAIGQADVEARLRLTLYLRDAPGALP